jgi:methyl-accepting chemotaxis protein
MPATAAPAGNRVLTMDIPRTPPGWLAKTWEYGGLVAVAVGLVGSFVLVLGVNQWVTSIDQTLVIAGQAVSAADQTIQIVEDALGVVGDVMASAGGLTDQTSVTLREVTSMTASIIKLMDDDLPRQIGAVRTAMDGLTDTAGIVDGILTAGAIFGLDYHPAVPLDDALREVDRELAGLPVIFEGEADRLFDVAASIVDLNTEVDALSTDIGRLAVEIGDAQTLIASYRSAATDASEVVAEASNSLRSQAWVLRILVFLGGLALAVLGSRLWWVGKSASDG